MVGEIYKYDKVNEMGYILGYDELTYVYHQNNVIENKELKVGDIVSFDYTFEKDKNQLPHAINIVKEEYNEGNKSYKELYEIIKYFPREEKNKIPQSFMEHIKNNMDTNYEYKVEHIKDFENQKMLNETRTLLALVYRDYLATKEEKQEILQKEKNELENEEMKKREKYKVDVFGEKKERIKYNDNLESMSLTIKQEETWFTKFLHFIKKIFN